MIAGSHDINPGREKQISDGWRDGKAAGDVLGIDDGEIDLMLLFQILQTIEQRRASGLTHDITDEKKLHKGKVAQAVSLRHHKLTTCATNWQKDHRRAVPKS